jgi:threonine dehydrogenase-like Zn-dependent dehydrogenase
MHHGHDFQPGRNGPSALPGADPDDEAGTRRVASGQLDAKRFITHHFGLDEWDEAYDVFSRAADTGALKVVLSRRDDE